MRFFNGIDKSKRKFRFKLWIQKKNFGSNFGANFIFWIQNVLCFRKKSNHPFYLKKIPVTVGEYILVIFLFEKNPATLSVSNKIPVTVCAKKNLSTLSIGKKESSHSYKKILVLFLFEKILATLSISKNAANIKT